MLYTPQILVVDDEQQIRALYAAVLAEDGYIVKAVDSLREAANALAERHFEVMILDLSLPDGDGLEAIREIRVEYPHLRILANSGFMTGRLRTVALSAGAAATLPKPVTPGELRIAVFHLLDASESWRS